MQPHAARHGLGYIWRWHAPRRLAAAQPGELVAHRAGLPAGRLPLRQQCATAAARRPAHRPDPHPRPRDASTARDAPFPAARRPSCICRSTRQKTSPRCRSRSTSTESSWHCWRQHWPARRPSRSHPRNCAECFTARLATAASAICRNRVWLRPVALPSAPRESAPAPSPGHPCSITSGGASRMTDSCVSLHSTPRCLQRLAEGPRRAVQLNADPQPLAAHFHDVRAAQPPADTRSEYAPSSADRSASSSSTITRSAARAMAQRQRIAAEGAAMVARLEDAQNLPRAQHRGDRIEAAGQRLADDHHVRA